MLTNVTRKLEQSWVMGFQNLRVADTSEISDDIDVYAMDFVGKRDDTTITFLTRLEQLLCRLKVKFVLISACIEFNDIPFAIIEFREKDESGN